MYFSAPYIDPTNDKRVWELGVTIFKSEDAARRSRTCRTRRPMRRAENGPSHHVDRIRAIRGTRWSAATGGMQQKLDLGLTYVRMTIFNWTIL